MNGLSYQQLGAHHPPLFDTTNCESEPIRIPGAIQPHGALLVVDPESAVIEAASESCLQLLDRSATSLLGLTLDRLFGKQGAALLLAETWEGLLPPVPLLQSDHPLAARTQRNDSGQLLIDLEPGVPNSAASHALIYRYRRDLDALRRLSSVTEISQAAAEMVRTITGFDQVMIYRFDAGWNGEVIAEARAAFVEPYLGLHFPASDIPRQARELFQQCRVRLIPDALYHPSPLYARSASPPIDLGPSSLRSVSPLHIEYLTNMGTRATLVGALVVSGKLWGLISCQHKREPRYVGPAERDSIGWLCEDLAALLELRLLREHSERKQSLTLRRQHLIESIRMQEFQDLLRPENNAELLGVVGADGFALAVDGVIRTTGHTPTDERIRQLYQRRIELDPVASIYSTHALHQDLGLPEESDGVAGALFVSVRRRPVVTMIWFRSERHQSLRWSGDPEQPHLADASGRLRPRKSFAQFVKEVRGQSLPWSAEELESATELHALVEIEELREKEAFAQTVLNSLPAHLSVIDNEGVIVRVNSAWKHFAQANDAPELAEASTGMSYRDICASAAGQPGGDEAAAAWAGIEAVLKHRQRHFSLDYPCDSPTQKHWFRMNVSRLLSPGVGAMVTHEDITSRKQAELRLQRSEALLATAQELANLGSWEWDIGTGNLRWSSQQYRIFGYEPGAVTPTYRLFLDSLHPQDRTRVQAAHLAAVNGQTAYNIEFRLVRPDGTLRHAHSRGKLQYDASGQPKTLIGALLDITDRRQIQDRLDEKRQQLSTILDNSSVGITFVRGGTHVWSNRRMGELFGYTLAEMENQSTKMFFQSEEQFAAGAVACRTLATGSPFVREEQLRRKDGSLTWMRMTGKSVEPGDSTKGSIWVYEDITDQQRHQWELQAAKDAAEAANREKTRFLVTVSHEIRSPLSGILGVAQLLLLPMLTEHDQKEYARTILSSGQTLLTLLNDLLDLAKVEAGKSELATLPFAPQQVIGDTLTQFSEPARSKGLRIEADFRGPPAQHYVGDPLRLRQMLANLVSNAIRFTAHGQIQIHGQEVERSADSAVLEFAVSDTGVGIPKHQQKLLFEPFSQAGHSVTEQYGGTGLGLSIVRALAGLMAGEVGVDSEPGIGSRFWFRIQVAPLASDSAVLPSGSPPDADSAATSASEQLAGQLLAVEDDAVNRTVMRALLQALGLAVRFAENGQEGVAAIRSGDPADLILMDLRMPVMDGYEATRQIRKWEQESGQPRRPIIALTADAFESARAQALAAGMDDLVTKPLASLHALTSVLRRWLPKGRAMPTEPAPPPPAKRPVDAAQIVAILRQLDPLLRQHKFSAMRRFQELQEALAGTALADTLTDTARLLADFRFEQVRTALLQFAAAQGFVVADAE